MPDEFDDLNMPTDDFGMPSDGMPDPTIHDEAPAAEPEPETEPASEEAAEAEEPAGPKAKRGGGVMAIVARADLYTVLLAIPLTAVLIAVVYLALEWGTYRYERNPKVSGIAPVPVSQYALAIGETAGTRGDDQRVG